MGRGFPGQTPNPSNVNAIEGAGIPLATDPGVIVATAPGIKGGDVPKVIVYSGGILYGPADTVTITVERDGVPFGSAYVTGSGGGAETIFTTFHWLDPDPGKGRPIYTVRAVALGGGGSANAGRTITVFNV